MSVGPTRFLTDNGKPRHPIVAHEPDIFNDNREIVKALQHQDHWLPGEAPPLSSEARYIELPINKDVYESLPEGKYDIDEHGNISNITAPDYRPAHFVPVEDDPPF